MYIRQKLIADNDVFLIYQFLVILFTKVGIKLVLPHSIKDNVYYDQYV